MQSASSGRKLLISWIAGIVALVAWGTAGHAHEFSRSESRLTVDGREIREVFVLDLLELPWTDHDRSGRISYDELDEDIERLVQLVKEHYQLRGPGAPTSTTVDRYTLIDEHVLEMELRHLFATEVSSLTLTSTLPQVTRPDHRHLISLTLRGTTHQAILNADTPTVTLRPADTARLRTFVTFLRLGVEHIFTGYDHLAFLIVLVMAATALRSLIAVVTSFTLAHSITLALATFEVVHVPTRLVESLIALSIGYIAAENLFGVRIVERYRVTFMFGLVHGLGFSNVLREMNLPRADLALSLFSFNAGVEAGQLLFVAMIFSISRYLSRPKFAAVHPALSLAVVCLGLYWFVERAFLS